VVVTTKQALSSGGAGAELDLAPRAWIEVLAAMLHAVGNMISLGET